MAKLVFGRVKNIVRKGEMLLTNKPMVFLLFPQYFQYVFLRVVAGQDCEVEGETCVYRFNYSPNDKI